MTNTTAAAAPSERERFERHVKAYTGRDIEYHQRHGTTGLEFGWTCWQAARAQPTPLAADQEPFGYFRAEPFGWTDCAEADEGAVALYERPTQPAVVEPLTPIRAAAFGLYTPPFRHEHGYIRDSNHQMVADDAGDTMVGVIAARIRGWGRIQYMDNPEGRAGALQDEVAEMVADALNRYWAAHGIGIKKENGNG